MQGSKIRLSPAESALFCDAEIILTKNSILQKTIALLGEIQEQLVSEDLTFSTTAKISRGENYKGLPYVVLDYPRIANGKDLLFIRSMFWWGHFFSSTLQVSGCYNQSSIRKIEDAYAVLASGHYHLGVNEDPWQHHFEPSNYRPIAGLNRDTYRSLLFAYPHIKIAAFWPLSEWDMAANRLITSWRLFSNLVA